MRIPVLAFCTAAAFGALPAYAQMISDNDGDGVYSLEELQAAFPALTDRQFVAADTNGDRSIDMKELAAAVGNGTFPT